MQSLVNVGLSGGHLHICVCAPSIHCAAGAGQGHSMSAAVRLTPSSDFDAESGFDSTLDSGDACADFRRDAVWFRWKSWLTEESTTGNAA